MPHVTGGALEGRRGDARLARREHGDDRDRERSPAAAQVFGAGRRIEPGDLGEDAARTAPGASCSPR